MLTAYFLNISGQLVLLLSALLCFRTISADRDALKQLGVTHVLNAAMGTGLDQINTNDVFFEECGIKFYGIDAFDRPDFKLTTHFSKAADFIESALKDGGKYSWPT